MIDQAFLLFERAVVLLVHHDQAQIDEGQEQGRPRPDHDVTAPGDHRLPHLTTARRGDAGMPFGWTCAEPGRDPLDQGLGQGDLGQQDQDLRRRIGAQHPRDGLQIGLGLARARHPVQQEGPEAAARHAVGQGRRRRRLVAVQRGGRMVGVGPVERRLGRDLDDLQHAFVDQALDHAGRDPRRPGQVGRRHRSITQRLQHARPRRRRPRRGSVPHPPHSAFRSGPRRAQTLQRRRRHLARRRQGPAPGPFDEIHHARRQGRIVQPTVHRLQPPVRARGLEHVGHHAPHQARPQRHGDLIAARQRQRLRHLVVEGFRHRQGNEDRGDFHKSSPATRGRGTARSVVEGADAALTAASMNRAEAAKSRTRFRPLHRFAVPLPRFSGEDRRGAFATLKALPMKLFLDTADVAVIKDMVPTGMVDGVTTNPSLIAKSGRNIAEVIAEICALVEGPISAEAVSLDFETMVKEGDKLAAIAPNVVVKLPLTWDGLRACRVFTDKGIKTNVTLCFSAAQALLAAKAGATFVSPFVGRLEDKRRRRHRPVWKKSASCMTCTVSRPRSWPRQPAQCGPCRRRRRRRIGRRHLRRRHIQGAW